MEKAATGGGEEARRGETLRGKVMKLEESMVWALVNRGERLRRRTAEGRDAAIEGGLENGEEGGDVQHASEGTVREGRARLIWLAKFPKVRSHLLEYIRSGPGKKAGDPPLLPPSPCPPFSSRRLRPMRYSLQAGLELFTGDWWREAYRLLVGLIEDRGDIFRLARAGEATGNVPWGDVPAEVRRERVSGLGWEALGESNRASPRASLQEVLIELVDESSAKASVAESSGVSSDVEVTKKAVWDRVVEICSSGRPKSIRVRVRVRIRGRSCSAVGPPKPGRDPTRDPTRDPKHVSHPLAPQALAPLPGHRRAR